MCTISSEDIRVKVIKSKMEAGERIMDELIPRLDNPMESEREFLMKLLDDNKDTEYGRKYDFANIHTIEDFQKKVPLTMYDDYSEYIDRMANKGEQNLITSSPVNHFNRSSGTMGNPKKIPLSDAGLKYSMNYVSGIYYGLEKRFFGEGWIKRKAFSICESPSVIEKLPGGATFGSLSAKGAASTKDIMPQLFTSPSEALIPEKGTNTRYLHTLFGLRERDVSYMSCTFFSYLLEQMRYIRKHWELLVSDIETGHISEESNLSEEARIHLQESFEPMPERAAELRAVFETGFSKPFVPKIWKNCRFVVGIGTANFKIYADKLREHYLGPEIRFLNRGIGASEGVYTVPFASDREDSVLIPDGLFYEFLPLDAGDDYSQIVTIDKLELGRDYEIILTNASGFYRYRIRDAVRVTGKFHNTPTVEFVSRIDQTISITGEKTTELALCAAVSNMADRLKLDVVDFSVYPDIEAEPVRYIFFLEIHENPADIPPKHIWKVLEEELMKTSPSMGYKIQNGKCGHIRVFFLEPETYMLYQDVTLARGGNAGQIKPVHIIGNEYQRKFFSAQTEYMYEYF